MKQDNLDIFHIQKFDIYSQLVETDFVIYRVKSSRNKQVDKVHIGSKRAKHLSLG